jgi:hypothetical protein
MNPPNTSMAMPMTIKAIPAIQARIRGSIRTATPSITNTNAGITSTGPAIGLFIIPLQAFAIGHIAVEFDSLIISSPWVARLGHRMHLMIASKQVMTDRNHIVQRAGCGKENDNKGKRENNPAMMSFHPYIERGHS